MKAIVAAGGNGTRMAPATFFINKHLVPIAPGKLMIDAPLEFLRACDITSVAIVTGSKHATQICEYCGDGDRYGFGAVEYFFQMKPAGIADILKRVRPTNDEGVLLILGDNWFQRQQSFVSILNEMGNSDAACCWEYDVGSKDLAKRFGQVVRNSKHKPECLVEKPLKPQHSRIVTGLYYFPSDVFARVERLSPSARGELEITDLLGLYCAEGRLRVEQVKGQWKDLGEWEEWQRFVAEGMTRTCKTNLKK